MRRRAILIGALGAPGIARAQSERPLRIIVPYPPGGGADLLSRALGAFITARHGRTVIVENRPGASTTIGAAYAARLPPDGETVFHGDFSGMTIQPLAQRLSYGAADFVPVTRLTTNPVVIGASSVSDLRSPAAIVERARARPGAVTYATPGILHHLHVAMEAFAAAARIELTHVPFQGSAPGATAVLAGQVDLISGPPSALQAGTAERRIVPVATMDANRAPELPGVPTLRDAGFDVVFEGWRGLFAPRGTPRAATAIWERAAADAPSDPAFAQRLAALGERAAPLGPDAFAAFWAADRATAEALLPRLPRP